MRINGCAFLSTEIYLEGEKSNFLNRVSPTRICTAFHLAITNLVTKRMSTMGSGVCAHDFFSQVILRVALGRGGELCCDGSKERSIHHAIHSDHAIPIKINNVNTVITKN
jgi:hypothetical protein